MSSSTDPTDPRRTALITGAGSGIGAAISKWLAGKGVNLVLGDLDVESVQETAEDTQGERNQGGESVAGEVDVRSPESVRDLVQTAVERFGRLDYTFANAGIPGPVELGDTSYEDWKRVMDVNVNGVFFCAREALPVMRKQEETCHLVITASMAGRRPNSIMLPYRTSKAAAIMLTHCLASGEGPGVRVNALCPGPVNTPFNRDLVARRAERRGMTYEELQEQRRQDLPLKRFATPEDITNALEYLLFGDAFLHGHEFHLDGGGHQQM